MIAPRRGKYTIPKPVAVFILLMVLLSGIGLELAFSMDVSATSIASRSLSISSAKPSDNVLHSYSLTLVTSSAVGSISFEYCQESPLFDVSCSSPVGLDLAGAVLSAQTGETGFSIHSSSTSNKIILTRIASIVVPGISTYSFDNITNPSQSNTSHYVRLATYASNDASGSRIDEGGLAFSTANSINVQADIAPYLTLCSGTSVAVDCSFSSGSSIDFGDFSTTATKTAVSQFAVACNDNDGYSISIEGDTLSSGVNIIPTRINQSASTIGSGQFGINLTDNTVPPIGASVVGSGDGIVASDYDDSNLYKYEDGDIIASSPVSTTFNRFTISYVVNISNTQPSGVYETSMTLLAVASF